MPTISDIADTLEQFAPTALAEEWDNVGLLVGDPSWPVERVMTCLTITPTTVQEAIQERVNLIVSHHPLPFQPLRAITTETTTGQLLLQLIAAKIGVYSPHTAFDSAQAGINQHMAIGLGLRQIQPLIPATGDSESDTGAGRFGFVGEELTLGELAARLKTFLGLDEVQGNTQIVGCDNQTVSRIAIACGSGGSLLASAVAKECDCLVTGEANFHTCLEAEARGIGLILPGHFASESFALLSLADYVSDQISGVEVWPSRTERNPLHSI
ncbi:MAG: Nif3-like dinuclear metal center hexameric protein [Planctomycetes bacterium]|nr:Nif3-like dinuclear metal center hexameric protein [Planctomycetota bacterium]